MGAFARSTVHMKIEAMSKHRWPQKKKTRLLGSGKVPISTPLYPSVPSLSGMTRSLNVDTHTKPRHSSSGISSKAFMWILTLSSLQLFVKVIFAWVSE